MRIISNRQLAKEKLNRIQNGFCAFAETTEVANLLKKELCCLDIEVHIDETDKGYWFIPVYVDKKACET